jgi:hypothetical protein
LLICLHLPLAGRAAVAYPDRRALCQLALNWWQIGRPDLDWVQLAKGGSG